VHKGHKFFSGFLDHAGIRGTSHKAGE
jgi:hypothetical protein